jgi:hypothetical protein
MDGLPFVIIIIMGIIAACIASAKGRNVVGWFFGGALLGLIGVIIVACLSNRKDEDRRNQHASRERRLLREQLHQERLKNQAFQQYTGARLAEHDKVLEIDTSSHQALPNLQPVDAPNLGASGGNDELGRLVDATAASASVNQPQTPPTPGQNQAPQWFVYMNNERYDPVGTEKVMEMILNGHVTSSAHVWTEGMTDPVPIFTVPAFTDAF